MDRDIGIRLGRRIRELRETRGLTQAQLGAIMGRSVETISNFERGRTLPGVLTLAEIAGAFGVPLRDLFEPDLPPSSGQADEAAALAARARLLGRGDQRLAAQLIDLLIEHRRNRAKRTASPSASEGAASHQQCGPASATRRETNASTERNGAGAIRPEV